MLSLFSMLVNKTCVYKRRKGVCMFITAEVDKFPNFEIRDSDIWVCSFPRSGTTLVQEMTYLIRTRDFEGARSIPLQERCPFADMVYNKIPYLEGLKGLQHLDSPRMIKSHFHYFLLPDGIKAGKGKVVYVARNPKSVVVSLYKLLKYVKALPTSSLRKFIKLFLKDKAYACPWWLHVREYWEHRNDDNVLFLLYEDVIKDRRAAIRQIADFLEQPLCEEEVEKIMLHTEIDNMRDNDMVNFNYMETYRNMNTSGDGEKFINSGKADGWKDTIPDDLQDQIEKMVSERLGDTDLKFF